MVPPETLAGAGAAAASLPRWMSASTEADEQLQSVMRSRRFERKYPERAEIMRTLFGVDDVYAHQPRGGRGVGPRPVRSPATHFGAKTLRMIDEALDRPARSVVEVGSFIGASARALAAWLRSKAGAEQAAKPTLICVDTWCGDINMWLHPRFAGLMDKRGGDPGLYRNFISNIVYANAQDIVTPLRVSSIVGARMLKVLNYIVDVVYIDASHEAGETFMELSLYYDLVRPGGVVFGDDYHGFPAVKRDVDLFCEVKGCALRFTGDNDTWIIQKPAEAEAIPPR